MKSLLYLSKKYKLSSVYAVTPDESLIVKSIEDSIQVQIFLQEVLAYVVKMDTPLTLPSLKKRPNLEPIETIMKLMEDIPVDNRQALMIYETFDVIIANLKEYLSLIAKGYSKFINEEKNAKAFSLSIFIEKNLGVICFVLFFNVLPKELTDNLFVSMGIKSIDTCSKKFVVDDKIYPYSSAKMVCGKSEKIASSNGFMYLLKLTVALQNSKKF
jgi:hypothetical protein